jgi:hypothetical protein
LNPVLGDSREHPISFADVPGKSPGFRKLNGTLGIARKNLPGLLIDRVVIQAVLPPPARAKSSVSNPIQTRKNRTKAKAKKARGD